MFVHTYHQLIHKIVANLLRERKTIETIRRTKMKRKRKSSTQSCIQAAPGESTGDNSMYKKTTFEGISKGERFAHKCTCSIPRQPIPARENSKRQHKKDDTITIYDALTRISITLYFLH